jgi:hypothetical protein
VVIDFENFSILPLQLNLLAYLMQNLLEKSRNWRKHPADVAKIHLVAHFIRD